MVYSNALYFASHFDDLTKEVLTTFNEKQKSHKNIKINKITLDKILFVPSGKGDSEELD